MASCRCVGDAAQCTFFGSASSMTKDCLSTAESGVFLRAMLMRRKISERCRGKNGDHKRRSGRLRRSTQDLCSTGDLERLSMRADDGFGWDVPHADLWTPCSNNESRTVANGSRWTIPSNYSHSCCTSRDKLVSSLECSCQVWGKAGEERRFFLATSGPP